ncbi:hypothetical protein ACLOJK_036737 [Asimina triloba]
MTSSPNRKGKCRSFENDVYKAREKSIDVFVIAFPALPEDLLRKKPRRFAVEEEMKKKKVAQKARKEGAKKGGGGFLQVAPPLPPLSLFLDLNEEPNPMWEEMMKTTKKPMVVFNRKLTDSDLRRDLAHCILDRREMVEMLVSALTKEEMEQFTLLNGRTELVHDNHLLKDDLIQLSYFRFG